MKTTVAPHLNGVRATLVVLYKAPVKPGPYPLSLG